MFQFNPCCTIFFTAFCIVGKKNLTLLYNLVWSGRKLLRLKCLISKATRWRKGGVGPYAFIYTDSSALLFMNRDTVNIQPPLFCQYWWYSCQNTDSSPLSIQSLSCVRLFAAPWTATRQASLSITNSGSLLKLKFIELVMPSNHLILSCPLLLLPSVFPSILTSPHTWFSLSPLSTT